MVLFPTVPATFTGIIAGYECCSCIERPSVSLVELMISLQVPSVSTLEPHGQARVFHAIEGQAFDHKNLS